MARLTKKFDRFRLALMTVKANRRLTSIRQQSDFLQSTVGKNNISASPAAVYRKREPFRVIALKRCEDSLASAKTIQICYDGKNYYENGEIRVFGTIFGKRGEDGKGNCQRWSP